MDENITKLNQIIGGCNSIYNEHLKEIQKVTLWFH